MKRREFLKKTVPAAIIAPTVLNGMTVSAFNGPNPLVDYALAQQTTINDNVLVIIQLSGGNDGLNTLIPMNANGALSNNYTNYLEVRGPSSGGDISISDTAALALNGVSEVKLHPVMDKMQQMYNNGELAIYHSVGYPTPNFSHFRSTDIWMSATDTNVVENSGWLGRYLETEYPGFPVNYPNSQNPHPPAIQIGSAATLEFQGANISLAYTFPNANSLYNVAAGTSGIYPSTNAGNELAFLRLQSMQAQSYTSAIQSAYASSITDINPNNYVDIDNNKLYAQLRIVAKLINGGLKSKVYMVNVGNSFDTHSDQLVRHSSLLTTLSEGIGAFNDLLKINNLQDKVLGMTFSEFGRRIRSNASLGTDHGAAAPMFLFGSKVNHGIFGSTFAIPPAANVSISDNIPYQYDFRQIYQSVLEQWFCVPNSTIYNSTPGTILFSNFATVPIVTGVPCVTNMEELLAAEAENALLVSPNPFVNTTTISFLAVNKKTEIEVMDAQGHVVYKTQVDTQIGLKYEHKVNAEEWATGNYYIRVLSSSKPIVKPAIKVR